MGFFRLRYWFILFLFLQYICVRAQEKTITYYADPAAFPPELQVNLLHLKAQISFNPVENEVTGIAEFTIIPNRYSVDSIILFTPDFIIKTVELNQRKVKYSLSGKNLIIFPEYVQVQPETDSLKSSGSGKNPISLARYPVLTKGKPAQLLISYIAKPLAGAIYFTGWRPEEEGKRKEIWAHRPHGWLPYADSRITTDLFITFDKKYRIFSNGERISVIDNPDGTKTWHYSMKKNHPYFSTALVIGDYQYKKATTAGGIPLELWYYTDMPDRVDPTYKYTKQMFSFFEKEMGVSYPYPVYREAPVIDYMYGAMETTTSTIFGDYMLITPRSWWQRNYVNVNAHELAHQWFGNYVAHFVNRDVWLTESFGTYYAKIFEKSIYGEDYYQNLRNEELIQSIEASKKNDFPVGGSRGGVQRIYQKGSLVLDMLRDIMGNQEFKDAIRLYLKKFRFSYSETNDFIRCVYEATGKPYNWFFDEWILRGGEPHYKIDYTEASDSLKKNKTVIRVRQVQEISDLKGLFKMPVKIELYYTNGTNDSVLTWVDKEFQEISIPNPEGKEVAFVLFDPGRKILKNLTFNRSFQELSEQLRCAKQMIDRYDALLALRTFSESQKIEILLQAYQRETFHLIKSEILVQLKNIQGEKINALYLSGIKDPDANVRRTALANLSFISPYLKQEVEKCLVDSSFLNVELALDKLCESFPDQIDKYLSLTSREEGWRGKNIRMKWLEIAITSGENEFLPELIAYTGPKFEFETRINAFNLLKRLDYSDSITLENAQTASRHWNNKLSNAGKEYLNYFK